MSVMLWVRLIRPDGWLITLGETIGMLDQTSLWFVENFVGSKFVVINCLTQLLGE